jgi:hypothetical protein
MRYEYQPLPESGNEHIRLATVHPGEYNDDLYISLDQALFNSDNAPEYEALSYCWGPSGSDFVNVNRTQNSHSTERLPSDAPTIAATPSLSIALKHLRYADRPRTMWIDAICIYQQNQYYPCSRSSGRSGFSGRSDMD